MTTRGILYIVWGDTIAPMLDRARASVARWHPNLPIHVERLPILGDAGRMLLQKPTMLDLSPFDETVFLDADTTVLGPLDYGFSRAQRAGIACAINECPWARRYGDAELRGDLIEYNTGVLFFTRAARPVFEAWKRLSARLDSSIDWVENGRHNRMPCNDQAGFAKAIEETGVTPFVLPLNWNYRPYFHRAFFGPIRIWHDYTAPPDWVLRENEAYRDPARRISFYPVKVSEGRPG
jgi:hypothetical protein